MHGKSKPERFPGRNGCSTKQIINDIRNAHAPRLGVSIAVRIKTMDRNRTERNGTHESERNCAEQSL